MFPRINDKGAGEEQLAAASAILPSQIPTLDGWRAVAILLVLMAHSGASIFGDRGLLPNAQLAMASSKGGFGVSIFFAISGFLITARLLDEQRSSGRISLSSFYLRRAFRILPAAMTCLAITSLFGAIGAIEVGWREVVGAALFFRNYMPKQPDIYTEHFWSLSVEEHFYALWPLLLILFTRGGWARTWVVACALTVALWHAVDLRYHLTITEAAAGQWMAPRSDHCFDRLLWGCWMAMLLKDPVWYERLARWVTPATLPVLIVLLLVNGVAKPFGNDVDVFARVIVPAAIAATCIAPMSLAGRFLDAAPMRWVGRVSYSLYLWQQIWLLAPEGFVNTFGRLHGVVALTGTFLCAYASYRYVERPLIKLGHRVVVRRPGSPTAAVARSEEPERGDHIISHRVVEPPRPQIREST
jgi:peptidoglycan/LPS O-acetylase OafA/YrhL